MPYESSTSGSLSATGRSSVISSNARPSEPRLIRVSADGTWEGSVSIETRPRDTEDWNVVSRDSAGTDATYTANFCVILTSVLPDEEISLNFTRTSGTLEYGLPQG